MKGEDFLEKSFREVLKKVSAEKNMNIPQEILNYIAGVMSLYYRGLPLYLIDIVERSPFKKYKAKGDVSLLLVGLFTEWIERTNRPLTERDYINAGRLNYYNAYMYLNINFGSILEEEFATLQEFQTGNISHVLMGHMEIFKNISENFEKYAFLLKEYRAENQKTAHMFDLFTEIRQKQLKE
ncbi:hypothetical protein, partial [Persephonella sp.]